MKYLSVLFQVLFFIPLLLSAQSGSEDVQLEIMASVVPSDDADNINIKINAMGTHGYETFEFSPFQQNSGVIMISGSPYSTLDIQIPRQTFLENQFGEEITLTDYQMITGPDKNADAMDVLSPAGCIELTIPESGHLFIRVGGSLETDNSLRGVYTGTLSIECESD